MEIPKFLIADSSEKPDKIYILHAEYPRFLLDVESDDLEWFDIPEEEPDVDLESEISELLELAYKFFDKEMESFNE